MLLLGGSDRLSREQRGWRTTSARTIVLFPLIESVHVLAICLVVGSILAVDLRLLGLASINRPVSRVTRGHFAAHLGRVCRRGRLGRSDVHFQRHQISGATAYFVAKMLLIGVRRPEHGDLSCHQRQGPAAVGDTKPAAASGAAGGRVYRFCCGSRWSHAGAGSALPCRSAEMIGHALLFPVAALVAVSPPRGRFAVDGRRRRADAAVPAPMST